MTDYIHKWTTGESKYSDRHCVRCGLHIRDIEVELRSNTEFQKIENRFELDIRSLKQDYGNEPLAKFRGRNKKLEEETEKDVKDIINEIEPCLTDVEVMVKDVIE